MIRLPYIEEALFALKSAAPNFDERKIYIDLDRLERGFFGALWTPFAPNGDILLIGALSGLEAKLALMSNPNIRVYVVEPFKYSREHIIEVCGKNIYMFNSIDDFIANYDSTKLDMVRIDLNYFSKEDIEKLLKSIKIRHLCGEMKEDSCDPLHFYRFCQNYVDSFYFYIRRNFSIAGFKKNDIPEVSIIVAAYGVEEYLDECIQSLVSQTIKSYEIIIVDDGSKDKSGKIADKWANKYPELIKVIHKDNGGCASARMAGLKIATGEYVAFVDGDDLVESPMYEDLFRAAILRNAEIAQCGFYEFYGDLPKVYHSTAWGGDGENGNTGLIHNPRELLTVMPSVWRRIYKRSFLIKYNIEFPEHIRRFDDLPFAFTAIARAKRISIIPDCYYAYRLNRPGQDVSITDERLFIHFDIFTWLYEYIRPWANVEIMTKLKELEIGTHTWALSKLNNNLKEDYLELAFSNIVKRYSDYNLGNDLKLELSGKSFNTK